MMMPQSRTAVPGQALISSYLVVHSSPPTGPTIVVSAAASAIFRRMSAMSELPHGRSHAGEDRYGHFEQSDPREHGPSANKQHHDAAIAGIAKVMTNRSSRTGQSMAKRERAHELPGQWGTTAPSEVGGDPERFCAEGAFLVIVDIDGEVAERTASGDRGQRWSGRRPKCDVSGAAS